MLVSFRGGKLGVIYIGRGRGQCVLLRFSQRSGFWTLGCVICLNYWLYIKFVQEVAEQLIKLAVFDIDEVGERKRTSWAVKIAGKYVNQY